VVARTGDDHPRMLRILVGNGPSSSSIVLVNFYLVLLVVIAIEFIGWELVEA